jgi:hypothetical protein
MGTVYRLLARCCHCNARCFSNRRCGPLYGSSGAADSLSANVAVGRQLRAWLRCTKIGTTAGATTTPASTVTQAALRRFGNRECCGRVPASSLAQERRLCADSLTANLASERCDNALVRPCSCLKSGGLYLRMAQCLRAPFATLQRQRQLRTLYLRNRSILGLSSGWRSSGAPSAIPRRQRGLPSCRRGPIPASSSVPPVP